MTETTAVLGGENRLLLITRNPLRDRAGETVGVLVIARDITEQRQLEDQLYRKKQMDTVARLAGGIAHDFNNLLTVIHGSAEILMHDLPEAYARRSDLEQIKVAASRAAELTRQVLAFSRQQVLAPRFVDLDELISQMKSRMLSLLGGQIDLDLRLSETGGRARAGWCGLIPLSSSRRFKSW